jgi:hypothetical protein
MPTPGRGRPVKFTLERIQQIKNLVERSKSREEIAELIGVTVDSLQVTCSRLGVSLRRPTFNSGLVSLRRNEPRLDQVHTPRAWKRHAPDQGATGAKCADSAGRS